MAAQKPILSASLLSADFARFGEEAKAALAAGADWLHLDVMDNHYVPNLTFGSQLCKALKPLGAVLDVHLMVNPVDAMIEAFGEAGADLISIHPETSENPLQSLARIRATGAKAGLVLNPATSTDWLARCLEEVDMVLVMSVHPGLPAQEFIPSSLDKIRQVRAVLDQNEGERRLQVDGGIKAHNIGAVSAAGADTFVVGSGIFSQPDRKVAVADLRRAL